MIRLGINIDHVATVRNARGEVYPDPVKAAVIAEMAGADNITAHLREDRRHVKDRDLQLLRQVLQIPLNMEMALTDEMLGIATKLKPQAVTLVPERRAELTTESGLAVVAQRKKTEVAVRQLTDAGILVSLFIDPDPEQIAASKEVGAAAIEIHTGDFCQKFARATSTGARLALIKPYAESAKLAYSLGLQAHFGHGLNYENANWLQLVPHAEEANIGHAIIGRAIFTGLDAAIREMKSLLNDSSYRPI